MATIRARLRPERHGLRTSSCPRFKNVKRSPTTWVHWYLSITDGEKVATVTTVATLPSSIKPLPSTWQRSDYSQPQDRLSDLGETSLMKLQNSERRK